MQAISEFGIASSVPVHGEATFGQIAESCSMGEGDVKRILRHAMTKRIFKESRKGIVAHSAASRLMAESPQIADWVAVSTGELWQSAAQTVKAMKKYPGSQEPNETV
jgi:site-specific recombinase XerC